MNKPKYIQGLEVKPFMSEEDVPIITKETPLGQLKFWGFGSMSEFRVRTMLTKEPETINWINSFEPEIILFTINSNKYI